MFKMCDNFKINKEESEINIKLNNNSKDNTVLKFHMMDHIINWDIVQENFNEKVKQFIKQETGLNDLGILRAEYKNSVVVNKHERISSKEDYMTNYVNPQDKRFISDLENYYKAIWENWYNYLGINTNKYPKTFDDLKNKVNKYKIKSMEEYINSTDKYDLPEMPEELYIDFTYNKLFDLNNRNQKRRLK